MLRPISRPKLFLAFRFMFGKAFFASLSNRRLAIGNHLITTPNVVPNALERMSKARHLKTVRADHRGKYLA